MPLSAAGKTIGIINKSNKGWICAVKKALSKSCADQLLLLRFWVINKCFDFRKTVKVHLLSLFSCLLYTSDAADE